MTVRIRTAARKLFLTLLAEIEPSRPLIVGEDRVKVLQYYVD